MKKVKINRKNMKKFLLCLGVGGIIHYNTMQMGFYINNDTHLPGLYYVNTKNMKLTSDELLSEFQEYYENSEDLQEQWDIIYPELSDFIGTYGSYLDQEELFDTLPNLKLETVDNIRGNENLIGGYEFYKNKISFCKRLYYKKDSQVKEIKLHEAMHYLFHQNFSMNYGNFLNLGYALDEGNASILVREYDAYDNVDVYSKNVEYVRVITELVGADNYMNAVCHHNLGELVNLLSQYSNKLDAIRLLFNIDCACRIVGSKGTSNDEAAWNIIHKIYEKKNGISLEDSDDFAMKYYSNKTLGTTYDIEGIPYYKASLTKKYFVNTNDPVVVAQK